MNGIRCARNMFSISSYHLILILNRFTIVLNGCLRTHMGIHWYFHCQTYGLAINVLTIHGFSKRGIEKKKKKINIFVWKYALMATRDDLRGSHWIMHSKVQTRSTRMTRIVWNNIFWDNNWYRKGRIEGR